eukprot:TRINITY_DN10283_c0_g1_i1.p1 TRINITY_DN10283_c0_g1~~TRINITY_DN10283_c0_g1_i1.p1  ORF type:complete len:496 (+),score=158.45 TRINITY_DN10283_c0_g1_i1:100-1587(+)
MVLGDKLAGLGDRISRALAGMRSNTVIDEAVVDEMLKEIGNALIAADVAIGLVLGLRKDIKTAINLPEIASGLNKRKIIQQAVFDALVKLLDPKTKPFKPVKAKPNVIMFVGLQGAGKTTTVSKLAYFYKKKGWKPCVVCADTFRAGAFDQLKQNAAKIKVPFYGSYTEADPVKVAQEGVAVFKKENYDIIIVDTSGRHKQEEGLFDEMSQISTAIQPNNIIFVMDGAIGSMAHAQAQAFKSKVAVGSVIITKLDGHAKGGGTLSAVAATNSPVIFVGTGEHMDDLEPFEASSFVSRLLGMGDMKGMMTIFEEVLPKDKMKKKEARLREGKFTLRDMYEQLQDLQKMGPINQVMEMIPGMSQLGPMLRGTQGNAKLKVMLNILDSCTDDELDSDQPLKDNSRIMRLARGAGRHPREVVELVEQHKQFSHMIKGLSKQNLGRGNQAIDPKKILTPQMMKQLGGADNAANLMKQLQKMGPNFPGLGNMKFPGMPGMQ